MSNVLAFLDYTKKLTELGIKVEGECKMIGRMIATCAHCGTPTSIKEEQMYALGLCKSCFSDSLSETKIGEEE